MGDTVELITLENRCPICKRPLPEKEHRWEGKKGKTFLLCAVCYELLQLPNELKRSYIDRVKAAEKQGQISLDLKLCSVCKELKEDVKTLIDVDGQGVFICTTCIDRTPLSAAELLTLKVRGRMATEAIAASKEE